MSDLISREDVIKAIKPIVATLPLGYHSEFASAINSIPTADNSISLLPNGELLVDTEYTNQVESVRLMNYEGFTRVFEEPNVGRWIDADVINEMLDTYLANCSVCNCQMDVHENRGYFKYCPNCGAKMERSE